MINKCLKYVAILACAAPLAGFAALRGECPTPTTCVAINTGTSQSPQAGGKKLMKSYGISDTGQLKKKQSRVPLYNKNKQLIKNYADIKKGHKVYLKKGDIFTPYRIDTTSKKGSTYGFTVSKYNCGADPSCNL